MKGDLFLDGKMFISSERAAKFGGYTKDYIGQLCRGGKLEARMVGRSWYVSIDSLVEHKKLNPEGKFWRRQNRSTGKNKNNTFHQNNPEKALPNSFAVSPVSVFDFPKFVNKKIVVSDEPLKTPESFEEVEIVNQISYPNFSQLEEFDDKSTTKEEKSKKTKEKRQSFIFNPLFAKGMAMSLALFISVFVGIFFIKANPQSEFVYGDKLEVAITIFENADQTINLAQKNIVQTAAVFAVKDSLENTALSFYRTMSDFIRGSRLRILVWIYGDSYSSKSLTYGNQSYTKNLDGLVVVPKNEKEDPTKTVERIKKSFSDEVSVSPDQTGTSGVITPVFKKVSDDEYLYVLVPVSD